MAVPPCLQPCVLGVQAWASPMWLFTAHGFWSWLPEPLRDLSPLLTCHPHVGSSPYSTFMSLCATAIEGSGTFAPLALEEGPLVERELFHE